MMAFRMLPWRRLSPTYNTKSLKLAQTLAAIFLKKQPKCSRATEVHILLTSYGNLEPLNLLLSPWVLLRIKPGPAYIPELCLIRGLGSASYITSLWRIWLLQLLLLESIPSMTFAIKSKPPTVSGWNVAGKMAGNQVSSSGGSRKLLPL